MRGIDIVERPKKTVKKTYWVASYIDLISYRPVLSNLNENKEWLLNYYKRHKDVQFHEIVREDLCE